MMKNHSIILYLVLCVLCCRYADGVNNVTQQIEGRDIINIGVIVDKDSLLGKVMERCIKMAIDDFYNDNRQYTTRISLHIRDSKGDSLRSIASALDLLETVKVHALIVPVVSTEELFISSLADKANVPLLSFSAISSFDEHPYYLQVAGNETNEFHGIAALSRSFNWKGCVILYEDTFDARQVQPTLYNILLENNIDVLYQAPFSLEATDDQIAKELRIVMKKKTSIIIVHLSPSLASQVFANAKKLGLMSEGFAWVVSSKTMNLLSLQDSSARELMQGMLGFKSYISASKKNRNLTLRWRQEFNITESNLETRDLNVHGLWAYEAVWALAHAIKRAGIKPYHNHAQCKLLDSACLTVSDSGQALLNQVKFELKNQTTIEETYEIVNVIGNGERRAGYWNPVNGLSKEIHPPTTLSPNSSLENIIWPGISLTTPTSEFVQKTGRILKVGIPFGRRRPELVSWWEDEQRNVIADGFCVDVFRAAFDWLQYNISFQFIPFDMTYSDLVDQVRLQNCDAAVGDISILANRSEHVDFTSPYTELGVGMVAKFDGRDPWFFAKPLEPQLWIMSGCFFVITGAIVWLIERPINEEFKQVGMILWFAASTLVFANREGLRSNISKFVVGIWMLFVLILTASYTANLSALLTVQRFGLTERDNIGSANPLVKGHITDNFNFDDNRIKPYPTAEEYDAALRRGSKNGGVGAIVDEMPYIKIFLGKYPNEYSIIQTSMTTNGFGFAFPKGSSLVPEISRAIAGMREEKKLLELENKWFRNSTKFGEESSELSPEESNSSSVSALSIRDFSRLFILTGISEVVALLLLVIIYLRESLLDKYSRFRAFAVQGLQILPNRFFAYDPIMEIGLVPIMMVNRPRI